MGNRWVRAVQKAPGLVMAVVVLGLGTLSAPVLNMEPALPADTSSNPIPPNASPRTCWPKASAQASMVHSWSSSTVRKPTQTRRLSSR